MYESGLIADRVKSLSKKKGIQTGEMLVLCGLNKDTLSTMQRLNAFPRADRLARIADYLDCSVDYLLGRTDDPEAHRS